MDTIPAASERERTELEASPAAPPPPPMSLFNAAWNAWTSAPECIVSSCVHEKTVMLKVNPQFKESEQMFVCFMERKYTSSSSSSRSFTIDGSIAAFSLLLFYLYQQQPQFRYALLGYRHNQNFRIITFRSINRVKRIKLISQKN
jgi:hypothetical protein